MDLQPASLNLTQVNQQLHECEVFVKTELYQAFCDDIDTMAAASVTYIVDEPVTNVETFLNREQVIGEARIQRTARNWFADVYDGLKARQKQLIEEQQLAEEEQKDNE